MRLPKRPGALGPTLSIPLVKEAKVAVDELEAGIVTEVEDNQALNRVCLIRIPSDTFVKNKTQKVGERETAWVHGAG